MRIKYLWQIIFHVDIFSDVIKSQYKNNRK